VDDLLIEGVFLLLSDNFVAETTSWIDATFASDGGVGLRRRRVWHLSLIEKRMAVLAVPVSMSDSFPVVPEGSG
jgi:hypothetical protein